MTNKKPFWDLGLNPITMTKPVKYPNEQTKKTITGVYPEFTNEATNKINQITD